MRMLFSLALAAMIGCDDLPTDDSEHLRAIVCVAEGEAVGDANPWEGELPLIDPTVPQPAPPPPDNPFPDDGPEVFRGADLQRLISMMQQIARAQEEMVAHLKDLQQRVVKLETPPGGRSAVASPQREAAPASLDRSGDAAGANRDAPAAISWLSVPAAKADPRPVWFHFTQSQGCVHCVRMDRMSLVDPRVADASQRYACVKIVDYNPAVSPFFHSGGFPADVLVGPQGVIARSNGYLSPAALTQFLERR